MFEHVSPAEVLREYAFPVREIRWLGMAGGLSGAEFWQVLSPWGEFCLRKWPQEHPTSERLKEIHAVLRHAQQRGFERLPVPLATRGGATFVSHRGSLYELAPWLPGRADYHENPTPARLRAAFAALGEFHRAVESFPLAGTKCGVSPGIVSRHVHLRRLGSGDLQRIALAVERDAAPPLDDLAHRLLRGFPLAAGQVERELAECGQLAVPLQPCIRDIWHDHVLFEGNEVTGIIDFGALRIDNPACDVARLLGSLAGDDADARRVAVDAYQRVRELSHAEQRLVEVFDRSSVLLSGMNWLEWLYVERRSFEQTERICRRLEGILVRLERVSR